jgi:NAD(P)-dependent dehydrogenase (short-subunit alcohol dehydrogenase family)
MSELTGKAALITGGGSGIGLAVARLFAGAGARVALAGRDPQKLRRAAEGLAGPGRDVFARPADVTRPEEAEALVHEVTDRFGAVHILVNNAGANIKARAFRELTPESWRHLLAANLDGAFYCAWAVLPQMRARRGGLIININSISGKRSSPLSGVAYNAAKFGLRALGLGLAAEEKEHGVRVANVYPGEVDTPILDQRPVPLTAEHRRSILQPEDVARAVLMIASLPPRATVPELVITPAGATYV